MVSMPSRPRKLISSAVSAWISRIAVDVAPDVEAAGMLRLQRQAQVFVDRQPAEQVGDLERAREPLLADRGPTARPGSSRPFSARVPLSGGNRPETRLNRVVLPAPFGPISAWISPAPIVRLALVTARMPPKFFETPLDLEHGALRALRPQEGRQRQALVDLALAHRGGFFRRRAPALRSVAQMPTRPPGEIQHEADEHEAEPEQPVRRPDRKQLAEQDEEQRAERRPEDVVHAADHDHGQQLAGERHRDGLGRDEVGLEAEQRAGEAGHHRRDHERRRACSARPDSPGTWRAAGSRGSPPAHGRTASGSRAAAGTARRAPISATRM